MRASKHVDKRQLVSGLVRLSVAAFSIWQVWQENKRTRSLGRPLSNSPISARPAARAEMRSDEGVATEKKRDSSAEGEAKSAPNLRQESRPKALFHIAISAAREWSAHRAASKGAALALYTLFSLAPMLILVVTIAGFFFGEDAVRDLLVQQMSGLMGPQGADAVKTILAGAQRENDGLIAGLVSLALVLVSATSAFAELKDSLDELWEVPPSNQTGIWGVVRERFLSFGLILVLALMLLASLAVSTALAAMDTIWGGGDSGSILKTVSVGISYLVSFAIVTGLFAVIFKYLPGVGIAWKDVFLGAVITAVLFFFGKFLIGVYVAKADISSSYGAAGSVVVLITWIYYSAQIFFYGSLFTHEYAMKLGSHVQGAAREAPARESQRRTVPATS
jgi:membrane protein